MWKLAAVLAILLGLLMPVVARADGFIIPDDLEAYNRLAVDQQIVVIDIQPNRTAQVDVFISFTDREGKADEGTYVFFLDNEAKGFSVGEESKQQFEEEKTAPLEAFIAERSSWPGRFRQAMGLNAASGNLLLGQPLYFLAPLVLPSAQANPEPLPVQPILQSDHTRAQILSLSSMDRIEPILAKTKLPEEISRRALLLGGRPVELIRVRTTPVAQRQGLNSLGLHISYAVEPEITDRGYRFWYSWGSSALWPRPAALTEIYVITPERLEATISFPRPQAGQEIAYPEVAQGLAALSRGGEKDNLFSMGMSQDPDRTVQRAVYAGARLDEDLKVVAEDVAPDSFLLIDEVFSRFLAAKSWLGFLALGVLVWSLLWPVAGRRLLTLDYRRYKLGFLVDSLGTLTLFATVALVFVPGAQQVFLPLRIGLATLGFLAGSLVASQSLRQWRGLELSRQSMFFRFLAFAALAVIVYNVAAASIVYGLWRLV